MVKSPLIADISVQFHTNTDDKDFDTMVQCNILPFDPSGAVTGVMASYSGYLGGHLADGSISRNFNQGWFDNAVWIPGTTYLFEVAIAPNGHDTWRFDAYLYIEYRYGPQVQGKTYPFLGHALSQDVRSNQYRFVL